jgi:hypothetical protein
MSTIVISDHMRIPVTAQRLEDGRILIRTPGKSVAIFNLDEIERLYKFARGQGQIQRHVFNTP